MISGSQQLAKLRKLLAILVREVIGDDRQEIQVSIARRKVIENDGAVKKHRNQALPNDVSDHPDEQL